MRRFPLLLSALATFSLLVTIGVPAIAGTVVNDHFDSGALDPTWSPVFGNALGWTAVEAGTHLTVTDITPQVENGASGGTWSTVMLSQDFAATSDFAADFDFSWDSAGTVKAMQKLYFRLIDGNGDLIADVGYNDAWVGYRGGISASAGGNVLSTVNNTLAYAETVTVDITRTAGALQILWNSAPVVSGVNSEALARVEVDFGFYSYTPGPSIFGTEQVDLVRISGTQIQGGTIVPLPSAAVMGLGLFGALGVLARLRRRRAAA